MTATIELTQVECGSCHVMFAIPCWMLTNKKQDGTLFHCPNGCEISYSKSENDKLKLEIERVQKELRAASLREQLERDQKQAAEHQLSEELSKMSRLKKRVSAGTCPCCKRTVSQLARHMKSKHPDFPAK